MGGIQRIHRRSGLDTDCIMIPTRLTVQEVAQRLSLGRGTVYKMLEEGTLPGIRVGRLWIVTRYALDEWEHTCGKVADRVN